jgi:hypothetical protein
MMGDYNSIPRLVILLTFLEEQTFMHKLILLTAIATAIGLPSIATAQTSPVTTGSIVCRPVAPGETANASIQESKFLCKPLNMDGFRKAMADAMASLSPDQQAKLQTAMNAFDYELQIESHYPGFNGNPNN